MCCPITTRRSGFTLAFFFVVSRPLRGPHFATPTGPLLQYTHGQCTYHPNGGKGGPVVCGAKRSSKKRGKGSKAVRTSFRARSAVTGRFVATASRHKRAASPTRKREDAVADRFSHIGFRGPDQRAYVIGTGLDVWEVIEARDAMGLTALLGEGDLPRHKVFEAVRYYKSHREEIDQAIAENAEAESRLRETEPGLFASLS